MRFIPILDYMTNWSYLARILQLRQHLVADDLISQHCLMPLVTCRYNTAIPVCELYQCCYVYDNEINNLKFYDHLYQYSRHCFLNIANRNCQFLILPVEISIHELWNGVCDTKCHYRPSFSPSYCVKHSACVCSHNTSKLSQNFNFSIKIIFFPDFIFYFAFVSRNNTTIFTSSL